MYHAFNTAKLHPVASVAAGALACGRVLLTIFFD